MKKTKQTIENLAKIPRIYSPTVSHSRNKVAFYWDRTGILELYTLNLETGETKQVSHGECPRALRAGFIWTRDDKDLIFAKDKEGDENHNLMRINIDSGETEETTHTPRHQDYAGDTSADGKYLAMFSTREGQLNLFRLDLKSKETFQLTHHENPTWGGISWNPKYDWIAYNVNETSDLRNMDVWLERPDGEEGRKVLGLKEGSRDIVVEWSKDGELLAFTTDAYGVNQPGIYNLRTGETNILGEQKYEEYASGFSDDGKRLVCLRNHEATVLPVIYNHETGESETTRLPKGVVVDYLKPDCVQFALNDRLLMAPLTTPTIPSALIAYDIGDRSVRYLVQPQYGNANPDLFLEPKYVRYKSFDGLEVPAVIYKPEKIPEGKTLPALIMVHGGPTAQYFLSFDMFGQILANEGYVLLQPNIRGSTGYGRNFQDMNLMDWGGGDLEDVAKGAEYLKSLSYVDNEKIGIFGGSYGGFMTFLGVTKKPELWNAACAWIGISHLKTFYELSKPHFKYFIRMHMGNYMENSELWEDRSAINFIENMRCPIMMVHGVNDPRCPVEESRQFRDKLIALGKKEGEDFEYVEYGEEGHGAYTDMSMRTRTFKLLLDFFNRRLK